MSYKPTVFLPIFGATLVWYDFALVGALAPTLSNLFFPQDPALLSLLKLFGVFFIGFLARPLGAIAFGYWGDRIHRQTAFLSSIALVSITTLLMGCLPTPTHGDSGAALLFVLLRFIQGIGAGGEHAGGILWLYESSEKNRRNSQASLGVLGTMMGTFAGFFIVALLWLIFPDTTLQKGAWRIPFWLGGIIGFLGVCHYQYRSYHLKPSPMMTSSLPSRKQHPLRTLFLNHKKMFALAIGIYWHSVVIFYAIYFYLPAYLAQLHTLSGTTVMLLRAMMMGVFLMLFVFLHRISDHYNPQTIMAVSAVAVILLSWPLLILMNSGSTFLYAIGLWIFTFLNVLYLAPLAGVISQLFPAPLRYTGIGLSINIASACFGGSTPLILTTLTGVLGKEQYVALYLILVATIATVCLLTLMAQPHPNKNSVCS